MCLLCVGLDRRDHLFFNHAEPDFDSTLEHERLSEENLFAFTGDHALNFGRCFWVLQKEAVDVVEALVEVLLYLKNILLGGEKLKQFVVRDEVEAGELGSLDLEICL